MTGRELVYEEQPQVSTKIIGIVSTEPYLAFVLVTRLDLLIFLKDKSKVRADFWHDFR